MDQDDLALITRCQAGDVAAFEPLVEKYRGRVWRVAFRVLRDREEAMDVAQETFIRAYQSLGSFRGQSAFYTWLFRIAVNLATDRVRQRAARGRAIGGEQGADGERALQVADPRTGSQPDEEVARREMQARIATGLEALPANFRTIIMLSDVEGLSYREIAEVLDVPMGTVMSRLHNARKRLQKLLKPFLIVLITLAMAPTGAAAQQAVYFGGRLILATDEAGARPPVPSAPSAPVPDPRAEWLIRRLSKLFRYKEYMMLERYGSEAPIGVMQRWTLPGNRQLELFPESVVNRVVRIRLRLARGAVTEVSANVQARSGQPALIGGPRYNAGVLIIAIWANSEPAVE